MSSLLERLRPLTEYKQKSSNAFVRSGRINLLQVYSLTRPGSPREMLEAVPRVYLKDSTDTAPQARMKGRATAGEARRGWEFRLCRLPVERKGVAARGFFLAALS